jgi:hypothetical protein
MPAASLALALLGVLVGTGCGADATGPAPDGGTDASLGDSSGTDGVVTTDAAAADFGVCPTYPEVGAPAGDCAACVDALCKDESVACAGDTNCTKQVSCFAGCKSSACEADCLATFPSAVGKARFDCIRCRCEKQCTTSTR